MLLWFIEGPRKNHFPFRILPGLYSSDSLILFHKHNLGGKAGSLSKSKIRGAKQSKSSSEVN